MKFLLHVDSLTRHKKYVERGIKENFIDGAIIAANKFVNSDRNIERCKAFFASISKDKNKKDIFLDPQIFKLRDENFQDDHYKQLFKISNDDSPKQIYEKVHKVNETIQTNKIISPNIYLHNKNLSSWKEAKNSSEFKTFLEFVKIAKGNDTYISIVLDHSILQNLPDFIITEILKNTDSSIKGFYILIGCEKGEYINNSSLNDPEKLSNLMLLNYTLTLKKFEVIHGRSDILSLFLNINKRTTGASGLFTKARVFKINEYDRKEDNSLYGSSPAPRYFFPKTLCRFKKTELTSLINDRELPLETSVIDRISGNDWENVEELQQIFTALKEISNINDKETTIKNAIKYIDTYFKNSGIKGTQSQKKLLKNLITAFEIFKKKIQ